jgi:nitrite reductase/ring-hydroxylating ferredoxin subunit
MNASPDARELHLHERFVVAQKPELAEDSVTMPQAEGVELIVIRHADTIRIFEGRCPHQGTLLSEGSVKDGVLTCRGHGWQFDCASGCPLGRTGDPQSSLVRSSTAHTYWSIKMRYLHGKPCARTPLPHRHRSLLAQSVR